MDKKLSAAQFRHDMAEPPREDHFLDTAEGQNWLISEARAFIDSGRDFTIDGKILVQAYELSDAVAEKVGSKWQAGEDDDGMLGQCLVAVVAGNIDLAQSCLRQLIRDDTVQVLAMDLIAPHADVYVESVREDVDCD